MHLMSSFPCSSLPQGGDAGLHISSYFFEVLFLREEVLGPLGAEVFIGLSEEEQRKRHIANVEAPTDKDVDSFTT